MKRALRVFQRAFLFLVRTLGAWIALGLVVLAFIVGYRVGMPDRTATEASSGDAGEHASASDAEQWYTCSMHPSVRLKDPNAKCPICHMDLIPVREGASVSSAALRLSAEAQALADIRTIPLERMFPEAQVRLYGKVTYDETVVARLSAYFPARIERLFVNFVGVHVAQGDHLAEVYSPELLSAFEELRQARHAVDQIGRASELVREATLDTLEAAREKLRLYGLNEDQIRSVEEGRHEGDRLTIFAPIGGIVTHLGVREGDYVQMGTPIATVADLTHLWLDLEAYESQLPMLRWGQRVSFTVEAHPGETFEGRISFIEPIVDERTRTATVRVAVENEGLRLKPGMFASAVVRTKVGVHGPVLSDELAGRWVGPMHPTVVRDGPGVCDICGMDLVPAETLVNAGTPPESDPPIVVPRSAVLFTGMRSIVYVRDPDADEPTFELREIVLGPRAGDFYIVREGLEEGEHVVVKGAFRVDSAMQIEGKPSMMSPEGGAGGAGHVGHAGHAVQAAPDDPARVSVTMDPALRRALAPVVEAYLEAQRALASDDLESTQAALMRVREAIRGVPPPEAEEIPPERWDGLQEAASGDAAIESLDEARVRFRAVSEAIIALLHDLGSPGGELRVTHCPMAFDFEGADWLQEGDEILNPYFGASMLRCGEVRAVIAGHEEAGR